MEMIYCGVGCIPLMLYHVLFWLIFVTCIAFVIISVIDYLYQKHEFIKGQKMTKDEIKREYKDSEGTPEIKGRRKQIHKELATQDVQSTVKKSTMVVANPTHVAIALVCYSEGDKLPIIGAKGKDSMAKLIKSIAKENNIPIVEYVPLARALFEDGLIDKYVPQHLLGPVGDTLSWVQKNFKSDDK
jgi:type III secretion protein U